MHGHQAHPAAPISDAELLIRRGKKRGSYSCGRCGLPKKGHKCQFTDDSGDISTPISATIAADSSNISAVSSDAAMDAFPRPSVGPVPPPSRRRALSFDDVSVAEEELEEEGMDLDVDLESAKLPASCLWEVFRKLPPQGLFSAAMVCRGWRQVTRRFWQAAVELRLRVQAKRQFGFVGSVLQKGTGLVKLFLRFESDVDATMLACIAFSCPSLQSLDILTSDSSVNRISGDELGRFVAEKRFLTILNVEGCCNLGGFVFSSTSLSSLCLSDLHPLSKMVFNCPNLKEISLVFSRQENDNTDITSMMEALGRNCPKLQNIHIVSVRLSHASVLALTAANLRGLRMLSLVFGSEITDASVAAITSSFPKLELLDLSGSSISDSGIGIICNVYPETLSRLLLALCPNITSSGIQFAAAQLPHLDLMDCGMTICDPHPEKYTNLEDRDCELQKTRDSKSHLMYQKLIIKHSQLKKLSLWGCSGLDAVHLNCPRLGDLNLNSCGNLHPERLLLQCPELERVHALDCPEKLVKTIETQVHGDFLPEESHIPCKRLSDGSKRVRVPYFCSPQPSDGEGKWQRSLRRRCVVITNS